MKENKKYISKIKLVNTSCSEEDNKEEDVYQIQDEELRQILDILFKNNKDNIEKI